MIFDSSPAFQRLFFKVKTNSPCVHESLLAGKVQQLGEHILISLFVSSRVKILFLIVCITDTAGMSWQAVLCKAGRSPLWNGSQLLHVFTGTRGLFGELDGNSVKLSSALTAFQTQQTNQRTVVWKCKNISYMIILRQFSFSTVPFFQIGSQCCATLARSHLREGE